MDVTIYKNPEVFTEDETSSDDIFVIVDPLQFCTTAVLLFEYQAVSINVYGAQDEVQEAVRRNDFMRPLMEKTAMKGRIIPNSPSELHPDDVGEYQIAANSDNAVPLILSLSEEKEVLLCSTINLASVAQYLAKEERDVHIICAGRNGKTKIEDVLTAKILKSSTEEKSRQNSVSETRKKFIKRNIFYSYFSFRAYLWKLYRKLMPGRYSSEDIDVTLMFNYSKIVPTRVEGNKFIPL